MKKILAILLIFVMIFTFASCGKDKDDVMEVEPGHENCEDYQLVWYNVKEADTPDVNDNWEIETPYLCEGKLVVDATVDFRDDVFFELQANENVEAAEEEKEDGTTEVEIKYGLGTASLTEDFANSAEASIEFTDGSNGAALMDIPCKLSISVDTKELGTEKPEEVWYKLKTSTGEITLILDLEWKEEDQ